MWSRGPKVPKVRRLRFNLRRSIMRHHQRHNLRSRPQSQCPMLLRRHRHQRLIHSPHHLYIKYLHTKRLHHNPNLHRNHQCACQRQVDQVMLR